MAVVVSTTVCQCPFTMFEELHGLRCSHILIVMTFGHVIVVWQL